MRPTLLRKAQYGTGYEGFGGVHPWEQRPDYQNYKSKYGPQYKIAPHYHGVNQRRLVRAGVMAGLFGASGLFFALFFFSEVPRVREDILLKVPVVGEYFRKETPPEDNPF